MRNIIWSLLMITVGIFIAGEWDTHKHLFTNTSMSVDLVERGQPRVVLAKTGTRQQKEAREQNDGCQVTPNGGLSQPKADEEERRLMKGLVF